MLGPFYERASGAQLAAKIGPEEWERLTRLDGYSLVAVDEFPECSVIVRTRWLGHDRDNHVPPRIFLTQAIGDPEVYEVSTATEAEALRVHEPLCARYRERTDLIADGGAPLLGDGTL